MSTDYRPRAFQRTRPGVQVAHQVIDPEFAQVLNDLYEQGSKSKLNATLRAALEEGWTAVALARALPIGPERVYQRAAEASLAVVPEPVPPAPRRAVRTPTPARPRFERLPDAAVEALRKIHRECRGSGRRRKGDSPDPWPADIQLVQALKSLLDEGYTVNALARALELTPAAVHKRLHRAGMSARRSS